MILFSVLVFVCTCICLCLCAYVCCLSLSLCLCLPPPPPPASLCLSLSPLSLRFSSLFLTSLCFCLSVCMSFSLSFSLTPLTPDENQSCKTLWNVGQNVALPASSAAGNFFVFVFLVPWSIQVHLFQSLFLTFSLPG